MTNALAGTGLVAFVALILCAAVWEYWATYGSLPTFNEYRRRHPSLFKAGRCHCVACGSGRVYVHALDALRRRHICATCGTVLYRS